MQYKDILHVFVSANNVLQHCWPSFQNTKKTLKFDCFNLYRLSVPSLCIANVCDRIWLDGLKEKLLKDSSAYTRMLCEKMSRKIYMFIKIQIKYLKTRQYILCRMLWWLMGSYVPDRAKEPNPTKTHSKPHPSCCTAL